MSEKSAACRSKILCKSSAHTHQSQSSTHEMILIFPAGKLLFEDAFGFDFFKLQLDNLSLVVGAPLILNGPSSLDILNLDKQAVPVPRYGRFEADKRGQSSCVYVRFDDG